MRKHYSLSALILASCLLFACGESAAPDMTADLPDTTHTEDSDSESVPASLPDRDFNGKKLRVVTSDEYAYQLYAPEQTGEVTNDAVYARNQYLEEKYNFEIESIINSANKFNWYTPIINTVLAGDDAYDLVGHFAYSACGAIVQNVYKNWLDIPYIDVDQPCWNQNINDCATINGKLYAITGYLSTSVMQSTYAVFFNTRLAEEYGFDNESLYDTVRSGKWTIDYFKSITRDMYKDLDGDGKRGLADQYGYAVMPDTAPDIWLAAFNQPLTSIGNDGRINIEINNDKTVSALEKLLDMFYGGDGVINLETITAYVSYYGDDFFAEGKSVFSTSCLSSAYSKFRDMGDDYGILTVPKWDEAQENYYTHIMDKYTIWGVPVTETDDDFVGFVTEAICEESYRTVYPAFYDVALKNKYSTDAGTAEMVDMLMEGATFDFAFMFGDYCGKIQTMIREHIKNNNHDFASDFASRSFRLDELFETYN